ncbi:MAG: ABC transporter ATP-binding protein [Nocardioides sp.]
MARPLADPSSHDDGADLLDVADLAVELPTGDGLVRPLAGVDVSLRAGQTLAVLGESGSGKTMTARAIMGILPSGGRITRGSIRVDGTDLLALDDDQRRRMRGSTVAMVFQDPMSALNPVLSVGTQIEEVLRVHLGLSRRDARRRAVEMLDLVGIPSAAKRVTHYPHEFSGGMRQRVMIAMALVLEPRLVIADEPTTALDVTIQRQILRLLRDLQSERNMALMLITHDMGVVAEMADDVVVMYAGRVVERAPVRAIFARPAHPYTEALLQAIPGPREVGHRLKVIGGAPPSLLDVPPGCPFHPRCARVTQKCTVALPEEEGVAAGRTSACHHWREVVST